MPPPIVPAVPGELPSRAIMHGMDDVLACVSPIVRLRAQSLGDDGQRWLDGLPDLVAELEARWMVRLDESLSGGTAAFVAAGRTADGVPIVLKVGVPGTASREEISTLERARGRGYVLLLASDAAVGAMLLEALGPSLSHAGLPPERQLAILCELATMAWTVPRAESGPTAIPTNKAAGLGHLVERLWRELDPDCTPRVLDAALASAKRRAAAFDVAACVVVHGDAAAANALQVLVSRPGGESGYVFVDPDGFVGDPTYDLGVALRDWCPELMASSDPRADMASYSEVLATCSGLDIEAIRDWAYLERVSTGLHALAIGASDLSRAFFQTAQALI